MKPLGEACEDGVRKRGLIQQFNINVGQTSDANPTLRLQGLFFQSAAN